MNMDFSRTTKQVGISMMLHNKFCTEYTMNHYSAEELNTMWMVPNSRIMAPRYELMRFFRVVPDQATGKTEREILHVYVVNKSTEMNLIHCEVEYTCDTDYDLRTGEFHTTQCPMPTFVLPPSLIEGMKAIVLKDMDNHCKNLYIAGKIEGVTYEQDLHSAGPVPSNVLTFVFNPDEDHY